MTDFKLDIGKIVGTTKDVFWSQTHVFVPEEGTKKIHYGNLATCFCLQAKQAEIDLASFGKEIISRFHEIYYSSFEKGILAKLKNSISSLNQEFSDRIELEIQSVVTAFSQISNPRVYFVSLGKGKICIFRENNLVPILQNQETKILSASGLLKNQDLICLGTAGFFKFIPQGVMKAALQNKSVAEAAETLAPIVHGHADNSQAAAIILKINFLEEALPQQVAEEQEEITKPKVDYLNKLTTFTDRLKSVKPGQLISRLIAKRDDFVHTDVRLKNDEERRKAKKTTLTVALMLIGLLVISIFLGAKKKTSSENSEVLEKLVTDVNDRYNQALLEESVNNQKARVLLKEAEDIIASSKDKIKSKTGTDQVAELENKVQAELEKVTREYKFTRADTFLDLALIKDGFNALQLAATDTNLYLYDNIKGTVLSLDLDSKSTKVVAGGEKLVSGKYIGAGGNKIYILNNDKISIIDEAKTEIISEIKNDDWGNIGGLINFTGTIYLLDKGKNQIWKYRETGDSKKTSYFKSDTQLTPVASFAIDGFIWLINNNAEIGKFSRGDKDNFIVTGLEKPIIEPIKIYTDKNLDNLYILDRRGTKVVVINKETGEVQGSYIWPGIAGISDIYANETKNLILLLAGDKIYQLGLNKSL